MKLNFTNHEQFYFDTEVKIVDYLKDKNKWKTIFPSFKNQKFDVPIYGWSTNNVIGIVDLKFNYNGNVYIVEIKNDIHFGGGNFWNSLKVLGYVEALKLNKFNNRYIPTICVEQCFINQDTLPIIHKLKLALITFSIDNTGINFSYDLGVK